VPSPSQFIANRRESWRRLEDLLARSQGSRIRSLTPAEIDELAAGYRRVVSDLAVARRDFPDDPLTGWLNQLAARCHLRLYQSPPGSWRRFARFFTTDFARRVRAARWYVLASALLLVVPAVLGYIGAVFDPTWRDALVPEDLRAIMAQGQTWTDIPEGARPVEASFIFTHNIQVALVAFAGGMLAGLLTVYVLVVNGVSLGAILGAAHYYGVAHLLVAFISPHGYLELSSVVLSGAAGLMVGDALLRPGLLRRRDAATRAGREAVAIGLGVVPILIVAGLLEGNVSPGPLPAPVKEIIGPLAGVALYALLFSLGRGKRGESNAAALFDL
jgi:uncharacterized membrane protein SpoIIM required for sporulation